MKRTAILMAIVAAVLSACCRSEPPMSEIVAKGLERARIQSEAMAESLEGKEGLLPRSADADGHLVTSGSEWWTSGFFPGSLWYLYEYCGDERLLGSAQEYSARVEKEKYTTGNHDVGFMLYCSFGNGYRLTGNPAYRDVLLQGAESLCTRYNGNVGLIKSWDDHADEWEYPVIIDNMMNLELLLWAWKTTKDEKYRRIAVNHADKTMQNHFRPDYSSYHVVGYNPETGEVTDRATNQGYSDESSWARGQAWGLYGFTMMYRECEDLKFLVFAEQIAKYILEHPGIPEDGIPYWDFNDPEIPDVPRDASAAAIMASAFIELGTLTKNESLAEKCRSRAETILRTLTSEKYLAEPGTNAGFVLMHSVGNMPLGLEVDVPLVYADYYYIEALMRYRQIFLMD